MQCESMKICRKTVHTVPVNLINPMKTQRKCIYKTVQSMLVASRFFLKYKSISENSACNF